MIKKEFRVVGVMSGTSLDGIDLVYVSFIKTNRWSFNILASETIAYTKEWLPVLRRLVDYSKTELIEVDEEYTRYLSGIIKTFIIKNKIEKLDVVCSHGHTALHDPANGLTYQIGNLPKLASLLNQTVVCDFRVNDVALGGQGAPLVPIGDALLFSEYDYCLNLGGFANVSTTLYNKRVAFDVCPVNIVLNHYVKSLGLAFDDNGDLAAKGHVNEALLKDLNNLPFYGESYPKSLGLEWVKRYVFPLIDSYKLKYEDVLRTYVEHVAIQISNVVPDSEGVSMLITGGGAYNGFLVSRMKAISHCKIHIPDAEIVEFKEALIFGFLGVLKLCGEVNCLKSVTGASKDHTSGYIYYG